MKILITSILLLGPQYCFCQGGLRLLFKRTYLEGGDNCHPDVISETTVRSSVAGFLEATVATCDVEIVSGPPGSFLYTWRLGPDSETSQNTVSEFKSKIKMGNIRFDFFGDYVARFNSLHYGSLGSASTFGEWYLQTTAQECQYFGFIDEQCDPEEL